MDILNAGSFVNARAECDSRPNCIAFNSAGWVKGPTLNLGEANPSVCVWVKGPAL